MIIVQDEANDGDPTTVVDEEAIYMAMRFEANDTEATQKGLEIMSFPAWHQEWTTSSKKLQFQLMIMTH